MVKILSSTHIDFTPTFEYTVNINGVTIGLCKEDFQELIQKLDARIGEDYEKAKSMYAEYWEKRKNIALFHEWLDTILCDRDHNKESLSAETVNEIYKKLIDIMY